jgi:hypothetical protein
MNSVNTPPEIPKQKRRMKGPDINLENLPNVEKEDSNQTKINI